MNEKYFFVIYFYVFNDDSILKLPKSLDYSQSNHDINVEDDKNEEGHDDEQKKCWILVEKNVVIHKQTPMKFVELMTVTKEAKQQMVQYYMRLVASITK